jgi:hypothetical protein
MDVLAFVQKGASYKGAFLGLNAQCFRNNDPACRYIIGINDRLQNVSDINKFLDTQTAPTRDSRPIPYSTLPAGVSNIYVSRVSFGTLGRGLSFDAL